MTHAHLARRFVGVALALAHARFLAAPTATAASAADEAETLIQRGLVLRRKGRDAEALGLFVAAYEATKTPRALAQKGLCEQALGRWVHAEQSLMGALSATADAWITKNRAALAQALNVIDGHLGSIELVDGPERARVSVNGEFVGELPLVSSLRVASGQVVLEVTLDGHWPFVRSLVVGARQLAREAVRMPKKPADPIAELDDPRPRAPTLAPGSDDKGTLVSAPLPHDRQPGLAPWGWGFLGASAVGVGIGTFGVVSHVRHASTWNSDDCLRGGRTREENCADERRAAETGKTVATLGFIAGGAFLLTSTLLFFVLDTDETANTAEVPKMGLAVGALNLALQGRF